jgi:hypothetical protein
VDSRDLTMAILAELRDVNNQSGAFVAGLLSDNIGEDEQIAFAHRLVDAAELIRRRAAASPVVVEGAVINDRDARQELPLSED